MMKRILVITTILWTLFEYSFVHGSELKNAIQKHAKHLQLKVLKTLPHDKHSFTEGFLFSDGKLFESTGYWGKSSLRRIDPQTGTVEKIHTISNQDVFAEGLVRWENHLIQLTYTNERAIVYAFSDFTLSAIFEYEGEGWGLTSDKEHLIMSNGSDTLFFRNPTTFDIIRKLNVASGEMPVEYLNELEYANGYVYANVWTDEDFVVQIDLADGKVTGYLDASSLRDYFLPMPGLQTDLNGIAYNAKTGTFFLTGKHWPFIFEVRIIG